MTFEHHIELGRFLRTRRARVDPTAAGLVPWSRRQSPGLRREELAVLANVSSAYYARLEQGNRIRASAEVLEAIAGALRLDPVERRYLYALNGARPDLGDAAVPRAQLVAHVRHVVDRCCTDDLPAYAVDAAGHLLAWNAPMALWYTDFGPRSGLERNLLWWMFTDPAARERIVDWHDHARAMVTGLRFAIGTGRVDVSADEIATRLSLVSPDFAHWWSSHDVVEGELQHRHFRHSTGATAVADLLTLRPSLTDGVSVVYHLPCRDHSVSSSSSTHPSPSSRANGRPFPRPSGHTTDTPAPDPA